MTRTFKIGIFDDEEKFLSSIRSLKEQKYSIHDVFTPYPVHEVFHLLKRKSRLPTAAYLYYTSVIDWPIVYGGKPFNSFPSFIVVTIVVTIFTVTIASLALFSARSKLFPGRDNTIFDLRATDDKFIIVVESGGAEVSASDTAGDIMKQLGAVEVMEKEFGSVNE
jgi:hypothetical protein